MSRSPTRLGSPAFGWIESGRLPAAGTICSSTSYRVLEPTEQLAPIAWTPSAQSVRTTSATARPVNVTPSSVNAICATTGRSVTARIASIASAISARSENVSRISPSAPPSTNASACSRNAARAASAVTPPSPARRRPRRPAPERRRVLAGRADGPEDEHVAAGRLAHVAGEPYASAVDLPHLALEPVHRELEAVGAERVALDEVGARGDVVGVDRLHEPRVVPVEDVDAAVERHPARVEPRAHRAVAEHGPGWVAAAKP